MTIRTLSVALAAAFALAGPSAALAQQKLDRSVPLGEILPEQAVAQSTVNAQLFAFIADQGEGRT